MRVAKLLLSTALASFASAALAAPAEFQLKLLNGKTGFQINGEAEGDLIGRSVASAGDVNGDGFDDVIVGARGAGPNDSGASYVVFGKAGGFAASVKLSTLNGKNGFQINGEAAYDRSGSVAAAEDVNGDGFDDLIIGASDAKQNGSYSGASYVVFGKRRGFAANLNLSALNGATGFQISGEAALDRSGHSVASAGDVNGDGFGDVIVGASDADPNGLSSGASYVVFGKRRGFTANLNLSALNGATGFQISGEATADISGFQVASAGDVNGDGFDDVIIGASGANTKRATNSGASYVVFGRPGRFAANLNLSTLNGKNGFQINGEAEGDISGLSVASAGDLNGDGFDDVIIGATDADPNGDRSGASYVVFGRPGRFAANLNLSTLNGKNGFQINGEAEADRSGYSVASAGDVNGDGFGDVIVGALDADPNGARSGASYVVFGKARGFAANLNLSTLKGANGFQVNGEAEADLSGNSVASAGDVNGDGFDDIIIGAVGADPNGDSSGASYVVFGKATGPITRTGTAAGEFFAGGSFNDRLNGAGGRDRLLGKRGNDQLIGGPGGDLLSGGPGADRFVYRFPIDSLPRTPDAIADFNGSEGDRIDLAGVDAKLSTKPVNDRFTFIGSKPFSGKEGELRFSGGRLEGNTTGNRIADLVIRLTPRGGFGARQIVP